MATFVAALNGLRNSMNLPPLPDAVGYQAESRILHLIGTDPGGSWCAEHRGEVVGFAQAARRGQLWVLAHLFVYPSAQSQGLGGQLLEAAHRYGEGAKTGLIGATPDPRAISRYAALPDFEVHPTVTASGVPRRPVRLNPAVRHGSVADLDTASAIDVELREGAHGPDLQHLLGEGATLLVLDGQGYAVVDHGNVSLLAALDEAAATSLLRTALVVAAESAGPDGVQIGRMSSNQQWAIRTATETGLALRPWGPMIVRGLPAPPAPYIPHAALC